LISIFWGSVAVFIPLVTILPVPRSAARLWIPAVPGQTSAADQPYSARLQPATPAPAWGSEGKRRIGAAVPMLWVLFKMWRMLLPGCCYALLPTAIIIAAPLPGGG